MISRIVVLPGDGIGPEVTQVATDVLSAVSEKFKLDFELTSHTIGGSAIDAEGVPLPDATRMACQEADAVFLGAVGGPQWQSLPVAQRPEQGLLGLRAALGVFANLRPVTVHPALTDISPLRPDRLAGVDLMVVRELTGGIYFGEKREGTDTAFDACEYSREEVVRITRVACELARTRQGRLTSVDKANVLATSRLWRSVVTEVCAYEFPDVTLEHLLVDAAAMHLLAKPAAFDVVVTENMFGDILTDEASMLSGSLGLLPSASLSALGGTGLYEPIHGSAPDIAGQDVANPTGAILSVAMMLRHSLNCPEAATAVEQAVTDALAGDIRTRDVSGDADSAVGTKAFGQHICRKILS
ncbi:MAG: 3-isopropylmalate dehydrogenase [Pseudomonadota bacterium]